MGRVNEGFSNHRKLGASADQVNFDGFLLFYEGNFHLCSRWRISLDFYLLIKIFAGALDKICRGLSDHSWRSAINTWCYITGGRPDTNILHPGRAAVPPICLLLTAVDS